MVIPIPPGVGGEPLNGPPPPELFGKFRTIKTCILTLVTCALVRLVGGLMLGEEATGRIASVVNLLMNALIGVFLMNTDEHFSRIYDFMMSTCCQPCAEQGLCQGGMSCLMPFAIFNAVQVVFDLLLPPQAWLELKIHVDTTLIELDSGADGVKALGHALFSLSIVAALIAQVVGAYTGWTAYQAARAIHTVPGDWGQEMRQGSSFGGGGFTNWGGGALGGGGGGRMGGRLGGEDDEEEGNTAPNRFNAGHNFEVFQGQGQRLGGD